MKIRYQYGIMAGLLLLLILFPACISPPSDFYASYIYQVQVKALIPVTNLTLYVPLPIQNGTPKIGTLHLTPETFGDERYTHGPLPRESNFSFSFEGVKGVPFLKITADTMDPEQVYQFDYHEHIDTPPYTILVNTRYPIGNESVLLPKYNLSEYIQPPAELNYTTTIYADYTMGNPRTTENYGTILISDGLIASNGWYLNFAWPHNSYTDGFAISIYDELHGWENVEGKMTVGNGIYLD
ncbi:MAG TPA: hypothetical protein VMT31_01420 [Methanomicrobiales archaeon]|nr:hypothetical protein [Methanomicrobiales archaeon]